MHKPTPMPWLTCFLSSWRSRVISGQTERFFLHATQVIVHTDPCNSCTMEEPARCQDRKQAAHPKEKETKTFGRDPKQSSARYEALIHPCHRLCAHFSGQKQIRLRLDFRRDLTALARSFQISLETESIGLGLSPPGPRLSGPQSVPYIAMSILSTAITWIVNQSDFGPKSMKKVVYKRSKSETSPIELGPSMEDLYD